MRAQSQIQRTLGSAVAINRIAAILSQEQFDSRGALGRRVCAEFDFLDHSGRPQLAGCLKALRHLEQTSEGIVLPAAGGPRPTGESAPLAAGVALAATVPERFEQVQGLTIEPVSERAGRAVWNTLIAREHRQGLTTFAGAQLRYLVGSTHGWLGALGFAAAALRLAARERWMGWSDAQRRAHLDLVVGLSRFLIRGGCANLASHVLGRVLRRLPQDFRQRYGYSPWLVETFCEAGQAGTSLRAANFVRIGETAGRGRQDRHKRRAAGVKAIYMYELERGWRRRLGLAWVDPAPTLEPGAGLAAGQWAQQEFGGAELGDKRLTARLVRSAALLAEYPGRAISANVRSDAAAVDGYYRLIEQPEKTAVTVESILAAHRQRSIQRMRSQRTVLCIQDGSDLNFATRPGCDGLEVIGRNQTASKTLGLHLHLTLAVNAKGLPLGVLRCGFGTPGAQQGGKSRRWIDGLRDIAAAAGELTGKTRVIAVMDREGDFFELLQEQRQAGRVEILVRAQHDRRLERGGGKLFQTLAGGPADGRIEVEIAGLTERPKASRKRARPARQKRLAACELRYRRVRLPATSKAAEPVELAGVHVLETAPPEGEEPVQWYLLTSLEVGDADAAAEIVRHYLQRWRVEDFFRVLKSGCRVEHLAFRSADRLQRAIAINSVIAWRIMLMTLLGREVPACEPGLMFTDHELGFLADYAAQFGLGGPADLGAAVRLVAHLGGYRDRKHDPDPGHQIMWHGYSTLTSATLGHQVAMESVRRRVLQGQT
ncbi:MAG: IS4 family transposase [Bacteroidota bacterium]|nr:IS4 family transposase [Bacteroidota bacterium]